MVHLRIIISSSSSISVVCDTNKNDVDFGTFCPSKSMDDWGFTYNDDSDSDSFVPGPQWDADDDSDDSCWGNNEEQVNDFTSSLQPSPMSVVVSKTKFFSSRGGG